MAHFCQWICCDVPGSLCRMEGNPARGQESTCSTMKLAPHSQLEGVREGTHPYLKARASTKAPLWRTKPCSSKGREVSQLEEPFSRARYMAFWRVRRCELIPQAIGICGCLLTTFLPYIGLGDHLISMDLVGVPTVLLLD